MAKKCIICSKEAQFCVKGTSDTYCKDCAVEQFGDITYLISVEEQAKELKKVVDAELDVKVSGLDEGAEDTSEASDNS